MQRNAVSFLLLTWSVVLLSQATTPSAFQVAITPDRDSYQYSLQEKVQFTITVTHEGTPVHNHPLRYELSHDMMPAFTSGTLETNQGTVSLEGGTMPTAGFLRCRVFTTYDGTSYEARSTVGFEPASLQPTTQQPADFKEYWAKAIAVNRQLPMDPRMRLLPERSTDKVSVYEISFQNFRKDARMYGILCVPKREGKFPAMLRVPGAGVRPYTGDLKNAEKGIITLELGIHGIPVTLEAELYESLRYGALNGYSTANFDNKDNVYFKRVYLGCVRAIDFIHTLPEFDSTNLLVSGGSQGGALSIVTTALDPRVKGCISFYPALSDMVGYLHGRAGGWPHLFRNNKDKPCILEEKVKTSSYYDVANFARTLQVPVFYSFGFNDMVCPPTTTYSVYNVIPSPKTLYLLPEIEHKYYPGMWEKAMEWAATILQPLACENRK